MTPDDTGRDALIGSTGFVGGNLRRQRSFGSLFHSANIDEIRGRRFHKVICAAPGAEKWKANLDPESDRAGVESLWEPLQSVEADEFILISTIDVYPDPVEVDEDTEIDIERCTPYGRHRLELERRVADRFRSLVVRLPGLFGPGLKKNALYDLLHDHRLTAIDSRARYQFYDVTRLADDLETARRAGLSLVNLATEPVAIEQVARDIFGVQLAPRAEMSPARYDFRTRYAELLGGSGWYLRSKAEILELIRAWVHRERENTS